MPARLSRETVIIHKAENQIICGDARDILPTLPDASVDLICTDPPYGLHILDKRWDTTVPPSEIWRECLRVLKPGGFAFVMSSPRQDLLTAMIASLRAAGFKVDFPGLYWAYASGFPKALNISKAADKHLGFPRNEISGPKNHRLAVGGGPDSEVYTGRRVDPEPRSLAARLLNGSYSFEPKPALEVIIVAMKPPAEKTLLKQALANFKAVAWFEDGRIPYHPDEHVDWTRADPKGRFPANLLVSEDALNDGADPQDSFSRFFDLDAWFARRVTALPVRVRDVLPFLIVPKPVRTERDRGCEDLYTLSDDAPPSIRKAIESHLTVAHIQKEERADPTADSDHQG